MYLRSDVDAFQRRKAHMGEHINLESHCAFASGLPRRMPTFSPHHSGVGDRIQMSCIDHGATIADALEIQFSQSVMSKPLDVLGDCSQFAADFLGI